MANTDTAALAQQVNIALGSMILDHQDDLLKVARAIVDETDVIKVTDLQGGNNFTAVSGINKPGNTAFKALSASSNPERFEVNVKLSADDLLRLGGEAKAARRIAAALIVNAYAKLGIDFWSFIFGARAIAHPLNGASVGLAATGGGTAYIVDAHTITLINAGTTVEISNDNTLSMTATNVRTVVNKRSLFSDLDGHRGAPKAKKYLACVAELQGVARNLLQQSGQLYNGAGLSEGFKGEFEGDEPIIIPKEATTSTDAWCVIWVTETVSDEGEPSGEEGPVLIHIQATPTTRILPEPGGGFINVYCDFKFDIFAHPNCHRDLQYSEP